jgi:hypothetical protein
MTSKVRSARIDLSRDLPTRAGPLGPEAIAKIFGGCKGEFVSCDQNYECCSSKCRKAWWISPPGKPGYWTYECLPTWATE